MSSKPWTVENIQELKNLCEAGKTKTEIAKITGRTVNAIQIKCNRLGITIYNTSDNTGNRGRNWRQADIDLLMDLWEDPTVSSTMMQKQLRRSFYSIRKKSQELNLGPREYNTEFLSIRTICEEMNVSHDRVRNWIKLGLRRKKSKSGKTKYLIDVKDLLRFLEKHQEVFNAADLSPYLFPEEPEWLQQKRAKDVQQYPINQRWEYSNQDDKYIQDAFQAGKTDAEIAERLGRTPEAIMIHRHALSLVSDKGKWSDEEIAIVQRWSRYKTLQEISDEFLPHRTPKAIEYQCYKLRLPYHILKSRCEPL